MKLEKKVVDSLREQVVSNLKKEFRSEFNEHDPEQKIETEKILKKACDMYEKELTNLEKSLKNIFK